eukprot:TRINITY_DN2153_c0_g1_i2.p1 TRINITY_DN2153_c0_g1~~TRINITY_DN2153_c0_g1_i2.p1  ORF type:complete len:189 (-),score=86.30 TRINITY_DN2153_c0_g1_i2:50-562(-)
MSVPPIPTNIAEAHSLLSEHASLAFKVANNAVLPVWVLLALLPRWRWTHRFAYFISFLQGVLYTIILGTHIANEGKFDMEAFTTLVGVKSLFAQDLAVFAGWVHYLSFDLFIGSWIVCDSQAVGVPHLLVIPCIFVTLMAGPAGLMLYTVLRVLANCCNRNKAQVKVHTN